MRNSKHASLENRDIGIYSIYMGFEEAWGNFKKSIRENTDPKIKTEVKNEEQAQNALDSLLEDTGIVRPEEDK